MSFQLDVKSIQVLINSVWTALINEITRSLFSTDPGINLKHRSDNALTGLIKKSPQAIIFLF